MRHSSPSGQQQPTGFTTARESGHTGEKELVLLSPYLVNGRCAWLQVCAPPTRHAPAPRAAPRRWVACWNPKKLLQL
nr:unnamed protein product [Digitaria exilis]